MGVDLVLTDRAGAQIDAAYDLDSLVSAALLRNAEDRSNCHLLVNTIDVYGHTRFSTGQAPQLLHEFVMLRETADVDERIALGRVISILRAAENTTDQWLEFAGD